MTSDPILAALEEQVGCYQTLAKLAEQQHDHVQAGRTEDLLDVLGRRQEVLDQIKRLESQLAAVKGQWEPYADGLTPDRRARAESLLAETRRLLEEITTADRNDSIVLQQRKQSLGRQINQASAARAVNRNYAAAAYAPRKPGMDFKT